MGQTSLVDIDRDGDLDRVVGQRGKMWWFEYVSPERWIQHDLGTGARTDVGGCAFDIDQDGWVDQVSGTAWYRNTGKPRTEVFERYDNGAISCHYNVAADIDGDGKLDVVACSNNKNHVCNRSRIFWTYWATHLILKYPALFSPENISQIVSKVKLFFQAETLFAR